MKVRLDTVTNIATLLTCIAIVVVVLDQRSHRGQSSSPPAYEVGETIRSLPAVSFNSANRTLLLAASEDCRYCQDSLPFYKALATQLANVSSPSSVQLVLVTVDDQAAAERFLVSSGLSTAKVVRLDPEQFRALRVPGTPTLVLADRGGKIEGVWVGKLNTARERQVLAALSGKG